MIHYLIRIVRYHWNPLSKSVQHKHIASKSLSLPKDHDIDSMKKLLDLLTKEFKREGKD